MGEEVLADVPIPESFNSALLADRDWITEARQTECRPGAFLPLLRQIKIASRFALHVGETRAEF